MSDKFNSGDKAMAWWTPGVKGSERRQIPVTVVEQVSPDRYRCQTIMGVAILFGEDDLS